MEGHQKRLENLIGPSKGGNCRRPDDHQGEVVGQMEQERHTCEHRSKKEQQHAFTVPPAMDETAIMVIALPASPFGVARHCW